MVGGGAMTKLHSPLIEHRVPAYAHTQLVIAMLRDALAVVDQQLDDDVLGAKLSECIEHLVQAHGNHL